MDWNLIGIFVDVVEAGSMSEAARRRGVTRSSISQRLAQLEQDMQVQLLRRTTRRLRPTEIGQALYEHGRQIAYQLDAARHEVRTLGATLSGLVRVSVPPGIGYSHIQPALIAFAASHPELALNVTFNNRLVDLVDANVDVALRIMTRLPEDVVAQELCPVRWQLYCTPRYLAQHGPIETPQDLQRVALLTTFGTRRVELPLLRGNEKVTVTMTPRLVSESVALLREAVLADLGVAQLSHYIVRDLLAEGKVVRVLPGFRCTTYDSRIFILTLPNRFPTPALNAVIDLLVDTVRRAIDTDTPD